MPFSRRHITCVTNRSQTIYSIQKNELLCWAILILNFRWSWPLASFSRLQRYRSINFKISKYDIDLFDLDPMILILKFDPYVIKMYLDTENEIPSYSGSNDWNATLLIMFCDVVFVIKRFVFLFSAVNI